MWTRTVTSESIVPSVPFSSPLMSDPSVIETKSPVESALYVSSNKLNTNRRVCVTLIFGLFQSSRISFTHMNESKLSLWLNRFLVQSGFSSLNAHFREAKDIKDDIRKPFLIVLLESLIVVDQTWFQRIIHPIYFENKSAMSLIVFQLKRMYFRKYTRLQNSTNMKSWITIDSTICDGQVDPKHEIVTVHDDNSFESKQPSFDEMQVLADYLIPSHSGFFNGDVRTFLKRNCSMSFDIVWTGIKRNK